MKENPFYISERGGMFEVDNLINYETGPICIEISGISEKITIKSKLSQWNFLLNPFKTTAIEA